MIHHAAVIRSDCLLQSALSSMQTHLLAVTQQLCKYSNDNWEIQVTSYIWHRI
jgi:hypothetical protein